MKNKYMEEKIAVGQSQFDEKRKEGVEYVNLGAYLICPKENAIELWSGLKTIYEQAIAQDMEENGKKKIIHRELANHESQITHDIEDTCLALSDYPITREEIQAEFREFFNMCVENDWF